MKKHQDGQSLVIIALMFLGLVAIAALVVDGGSLYLNRRSAQTAADAAAMAGARTLCVDKGTDSDIQLVVNKYALTENGATSVDTPTVVRTADATTGAIGSVSVRTTVSTTSFISGILGFKNNKVTADASAGCFLPSTGKNLLPVAWSCQPPAGPSGPSSGCIIHSIPWKLFNEQIYPTYKSDLNENGNLVLDEGDDATVGSYMDNLPLTASGLKEAMAYIVMDANSFDPSLECAYPVGSGTLGCDLNNDGILDISGASDRGWISITGSGGASTLFDILLNGYANPITLPQWFPSDTGGKSSAYNQAKGNIEGKIAFVPVYNSYCLNVFAADVGSCPGYLSTDDITAGSGQSTYVRVTSFAPFMVTCISRGNSEKCPAKTFAGFTTPHTKSIPTIEGYFVNGYAGGTAIDPSSFDLGVYIISLMK